jgi:hypothetical protein
MNMLTLIMPSCHAICLLHTEDSLCERIRSEAVLIRAAALTAIDDAALRELEAAFHLGEEADDPSIPATTANTTNTTINTAKHDTDATASGATTPTTSTGSSMIFGSGAGVQKLQALFSRSASSAV